MQFDILNEILTSTVYGLFTDQHSIMNETKVKVKELETLIKSQNSAKRNIHNDSMHSLGKVSADSRQGSLERNLVKFKGTPQEWLQFQSPKRLKESLRKIGIRESLMVTSKKAELQKLTEKMSEQDLNNQKKKVKNQLRLYDNAFKHSFDRDPNYAEKQPFRPLYFYYKILKQALNGRTPHLTPDKIQAMIEEIKGQRKVLRDKIQAYQAEFEKNNNRKIRIVKDIQPIQKQYQKYKQLKQTLLKYQDMLKG